MNQSAERDSLLRAALMAASDAILIVDRGGHIVLANPAAEACVQRPIPPGTYFADMAGCIGLRDGALPLVPEQMPLARALAGEPVPEIALVMTRADGMETHMAARADPLRDASGAVTGAILVARVLSERSRLLADLQDAERHAREEEESARRLRGLLSVTDAALRHLDLDALLLELLSRVRDLLGADTATILLLAEDGTRLEVRASVGLEDEVGEHVTVPVERGIAGRLVRNGEPLIISDLSHFEVFSPILREHISSLAGVPLLAAGRAIGAIHVGSIARREFSETDLELLQRVADRAALAIENARLYQQVHFERIRWQATVESMLDPVTVCDAAGQAVYLNPAYSRLIQRPVPPHLAVADHPTYWQLYHPDGTLFAADDLPLQRAALNGEAVRDVEIVQRAPDGQEFVAVFSAAPLRDPAGMIIGAVAVGHDVTDQRRVEAERERLMAEIQEAHAEALLRADEAQARAAERKATIEAIADGVSILGPTGEIVMITPAAERLFGYTDEEWALPLAERVAVLGMRSPAGTPFTAATLPGPRALRGETVRNEIIVMNRPPDREIWMSVSAAPITAPDGRRRGAAISYTDLTAMHELQVQLEDLIRTISHDLRNPLTVVTGQAQWLHQLLSRQGQEREARRAEAIVKSSRQMAAMIGDLLESAHLESGRLEMRPEPLNLFDLAADLAERVGTAEDRARLRVESPDWVPPVYADPHRLERAVVNLISNALKYSKSDQPVLVRVEQRGHEAVLSVVDRGIGIAADEMPHLFERFYRARNASRVEGLGLGLYIARLIVEANGGRVWAESTPGAGSTFSLALPIPDSVRPA